MRATSLFCSALEPIRVSTHNIISCSVMLQMLP